MKVDEESKDLKEDAELWHKITEEGNEIAIAKFIKDIFKETK